MWCSSKEADSMKFINEFTSPSLPLSILPSLLLFCECYLETYERNSIFHLLHETYCPNWWGRFNFSVKSLELCCFLNVRKGLFFFLQINCSPLTNSMGTVLSSIKLLPSAMWGKEKEKFLLAIFTPLPIPLLVEGKTEHTSYSIHSTVVVERPGWLQ